MAKVLGIDTGGTFTDSVVVDTVTREVLCKAKALTTKADLSEGIVNSLSKLPDALFREVSYVALSTTLATNAIVEKRYRRTGVVLIGRRPDGELPADEIVMLDGSINIKGQITKDLDQEQLAETIESLRGKVDVVAVSGFSSVRNPVHEKTVGMYVREHLDLPVICSHELSGQLGFYERTVTCVLNAGLLPIIQELIVSVRTGLHRKNIDCPVMVVRGNGSLMHESVALQRPVETLVSGPAASVIGASFLTGMEFGLILDMGGTTTDIANLTGGKAEDNMNGAVVGGWSTQIRATDICSFGLGGDSYIYYDNKGNITVGPKKVMPICVLAMHHPHIIEELRTYRKPEGYELLREKSTDCFAYLREPDGEALSDIKRSVLNCLKDKPHSLYWLAAHFEKDADKLGLTEMVEAGYIERASMTPTDVLVAEGHLNQFNRDGAEIVRTIIADIGGKSALDFTIEVKRLIYQKVARLIIQSACHFDGEDFALNHEKAAEYFLDIAFKGNGDGMLRSEFRLSKPIIAIGAPVKAWLYNAGQYLNTTVVIPEHSEVANAIGAAVADIREEKKIIIRYDKVTAMYVVYTGEDRLHFEDLEEAKTAAEGEAAKQAQDAATLAGCPNSQVTVETKDRYTEIFTSGARHYVETEIIAVAWGRPKWEA